MKTFTAYNEEGRITFSNLVYESQNYGDVLNERGIKHHATERQRFADPVEEFVWNGELCNRPHMHAIQFNKGRMKAGDKDPIVIKNIPKGVRVNIRVEGISMALFDGEVNDTTLALEVDVPGIYIVTIARFPMRDWQGTFEVVS